MSRRPRPEILAPAGDAEALAAALAAGADAVYFGLDDGFNARARAANFPSHALTAPIATIHRAGARAYVALNTLVFEPELAIVEELVRRVAAAGADAIIVQDPAVALIARAVCPALELHASTQMTVSSALAAELVAELGLTRVVVPRELSIADIRAYREGTRLELEVFVHGALCVAWSGQCLSSEAWGGRSANRGQCAQACRLPYDLIVDGEHRDLGEVAYLLSPHDLVALDDADELAAAGVVSLKIEGRLKGPAYVATTVTQYRAALGAPALTAAPLDRDALRIAYSRGDSAGFLRGVDHQVLVDGRTPRHRGVLLGSVTQVNEPHVHVRAAGAAPAAGMGVVFDLRSARSGRAGASDRGRPEQPETGGPIFDTVRDGDGWTLTFGEPGPELARVSVGDRVWITSDPRVTRAGTRAVEQGAQPLGRLPVALAVRGSVGEPLEVVATVGSHRAIARSTSALQAARGAGLSGAMLVDKLAAFGGTSYHLAGLETAGLAAGLHLPVSELKALRRELVAALDVAIARVDREVAEESVIERLRSGTDSDSDTGSESGTDSDADAVSDTDTGTEMRATSDRGPLLVPLLIPLCRSDAQLDAVLAAGAREVELDWMELVGLGRAVERARAAGARVTLATLRVQKPGEEKIDAHLARLAPDAVLVRGWGSLAYFHAHEPGTELHGDFSLNVTNSLTARWALGHGLTTVTAAHDLDRDQLFALLAATPPGRVAVTVHHHIPTFHTEHCVYAHLLSSGRDFRTCGRPCEQHRVALRDRIGLVHPVLVDVACRNTVFNAQAQSAAALIPELVARGVSRLRVELVRESGPEAARVYTAYRRLVAGELAATEVVRTTAAHEQFGVTRGTMRTLAVLT